MITHTGNGDIMIYFWITHPLHILEVAIQLQLLVCDILTRVGIFSEKMPLSARMLARLS